MIRKRGLFDHACNKIIQNIPNIYIYILSLNIICVLHTLAHVPHDSYDDELFLFVVYQKLSYDFTQRQRGHRRFKKVSLWKFCCFYSIRFEDFCWWCHFREGYKIENALNWPFGHYDSFEGVHLMNAIYHRKWLC